MLESLKEILEDYIEIDAENFSIETSLRTDMGLDSLQLVSIILALEEKYAITIDEHDVLGLQTVGDVIAYIEDAQKRANP